MKFFKELWFRFWSATPKTFRKLQAVCATLSACGLFLKEHELDYSIYGISVVSVLIGAGVFGVIGNQFVVKDYQKLEEKLS